ncbi:MAG: hypothetical protein KatS3mg111_2837 [Pirellulaceae bacterium]|nr:MAG: hypothetical protein KatS3mg111_2837 [Pirellulaceae bacterium]
MAKKLHGRVLSGVSSSHPHNNPPHGVQEFARLAGQVRRRLRWQAGMAWSAWVIGTLTAVSLVDVVVRREETGLRLLSFLTVIGVAIVGAWKLLRPAWRIRPTAVDVARWIERHHPEFGQRLSTLIELQSASAEDGRWGSLEFRVEAMRRLDQEISGRRWQDFLESGHLYRAAFLLAATMFLAAGIAAWRPQDVALAARRVLLPWAPVYWPRADQLFFRDLPTAVAAGTELQLEIADAMPPLPSDVLLEMRRGDGETVETIPATLLGEIAVANLPPLTQSVQVRAVGGEDHSMAWHPLQVVAPPRLEESSFHVSPPEYTAREPHEIAGRQIRVLAGSTVELHGTLSHPVHAISLTNAHSASPLPLSLVARLSSDRQQFVVTATDGPWVVTESQSWYMTLHLDEDLQVRLPDTWTIEAVADLPPKIAIHSPPSALATRALVLHLIGEATDDIGVASIALMARVADSATEQAFESDGDADVPAAGTTPHRVSIWDAGEQQSLTTRQPFVFDWEPGQHLALTDEPAIEFWLEAVDHAGQIGKTDVFRIEFRPAEEVLLAAEQQRRRLSESVAEALDLQRRNTQLLERTVANVHENQEIDAAVVDAAGSMAHAIQAIEERLSSGESSAQHQLRALEELLDQNHLADTDFARDLQGVAAELRGLIDAELAEARRRALELAQATRADMASGGEPEQTNAALSADRKAQQALSDRLQALLTTLSHGDAMRQMVRELTQLAQQQQRVGTDTRQLQVEAIGGLSPDEFQRRVEDLVADQQSLARLTDDLADRMDGLPPAPNDALQSQRDALRAAAASLAREQASNSMRSSADALQRGELAQAVKAQRQAEETLRQALQATGAGDLQSRLSNQAQRLQEASQTLSSLAEQQRTLAQSLDADDADQVVDEARRDQQQQLRAAASLEQEKLASAGDHRTAAAVEQAIGAQEDALRAMEQQRSNAASQAAHRAAAALAEAAAQLQDRSRQLQNVAWEEESHRLADEVESVVQRQQPLLAEWESLAAEQSVRRHDGDWQSNVRAAAAQQVALHNELRQIQSRVADTPAFGLALQQAGDAMELAALTAQRYRVAPETVEYARASLRKLELAAAALRPNAAEGDESPGDDTSPSGEDPGEPTPPPLVSPIASLKLLRALQADLNARTDAIINQIEDPATRTRLLTQVAAEQEAMGKQVAALIESVVPAPSPESKDDR